MNFLQKGLAGLESRLDKVLLDEQPLPQPQPQPQPQSQSQPQQPQPHPEQPRHSSPARMTMQERLAAAVSSKKAAANGHEEPERRGVQPAAAAEEEEGGGAVEKRLAEAQEKIALLLEEGEKLSRGELRLRNTIRELRGRAQEEEKGAAEARRRAERAEGEAREARRRAERAEGEAREARERGRRAAEEARRDRERVRGVARLEGEVQALRAEREGLLAAVAELNGRVEEGARRAEEAQTEALEAERARGVELAAEVQRVKGEAAAVEGRLNVEVADLKSKISRDAERARSMELELKAEQAVMERKMEALRARAEEVSSGASGDAHAKLLRQVETLQTQYAIASENWQGIEGSMLARIAGLEKERDELTKKEADIRRKARDLSIKSKNLDMDLETANSRIKDLESDLTIAQQTTSTLQTRLKTAEGELSTLRSNFEHERAAWQRDLDTKLHEERQKWGNLPAADSRPSSPLNLHNMHTLSTSTPSLPALRKSSGPLSTTESYFLGATRKPSRSPSADPPTATSTPTEHPPRRGFTTPPIGFGTPPPRPAPLPMPPAPEEDDTDYFDNIPFSPLHRGDMVSVSTVAAGPSVQLVERMSATVRRLESEMAGAREEAAAITAQRDEARREIVELVREVEDGRGRADCVRALEAEVAELRRREEAMLQLLGEKSELVEELKADVQDLKGMYRDLVSGYGK